ncbi:hypothetical protein [Mucilaginibacter paludis]|uniref:DUF4468 domain-containing protein n=1 Tax=Mucilaginibacter paludis DSM 18603 TaxID=714943 RepID=H1Y0B9_9SPHI|nr:hypothetical protein [Mucilaginibacter paludis]EHQ28168.1 hypothetical protein Mucpa_4077 [Mucilaginibacter paludis DSM 18603]
MKKLSILSALLAPLFFLSLKAEGQAGVPASFRGDFNRMQSNAAMNMNMNRMMNQRWYFGMNYMVNKKYKFKVMMKDSSVKEVKSKIYADTTTHKSYLMYTDKALPDTDPNRYKEIRIYCDKTLNISRSGGGATYTVMATDSCWLFKVIWGKVNAYSNLSETDDIDSYYLRAFQVFGGSIQKLDSASLAPVIKENPKAVKALKKKDYYKAILQYNTVD